MGRKKLTEIEESDFTYRIDQQELSKSFDQWFKQYRDDQSDNSDAMIDGLHSLYGFTRYEFGQALGRAGAKDVWDELGK